MEARCTGTLLYVFDWVWYTPQAKVGTSRATIHTPRQKRCACSFIRQGPSGGLLTVHICWRARRGDVPQGGGLSPVTLR